MKRYGQIVKVRSDKKEEYINYHKNVWPEVLKTISECNIRNYSIFIRDDLLFSYFEYIGTDFKADMKKMAACPHTQKWWSVVRPMLEPVVSCDWYVDMEEIFHID